MSPTGAASRVNNVVLVHGGFVDGSGWEGVYKILKKDGYNVSVVQNSDDVAGGRRRSDQARRSPRRTARRSSSATPTAAP